MFSADNQPARHDRVPVAPLRDAVVRRIEQEARAHGSRRSSVIDDCTPLNFNRLSIYLWGERSPGKGDPTRLQRRLGIKPVSRSTPGPRRASKIRYELAVSIALAAGIEPVDVGL